MNRLAIIRAGALAAVAGGVLRALGSFAPAVVKSETARDTLYLAIDTCLVAGLLAFYAQHSRRLRWWGLAGLLLALIGITIVRSNRLIPATALYPLGALATAIGLVLLSADAWLANQLRQWVYLSFALSLSLGILGSLLGDGDALFVAAGLSFGAAFAGLGAATWTASLASDVRSAPRD